MKNLTRTTLLLLLLSAFSLAFASDLSPTASLTVSPTKGSFDTVFTFDASASTDSRGFNSTLEYRWSFNLGVTDWTDWSDDAVMEYQYISEGTKQIKVEIQDEDGYTDYAWAEVDVDEDLSYETEFNVSPETGDTNTVFEFDIDTTTSISIGVDNFEYRWDFDGDGEWDTDYMSATAIEHSYGDNGTYVPILEVLAPDETTTVIRGYEDDGASSGGYILVYSSDYPSAAIEVYPASGDENTRFYFSAENSWDADELRWDYEGDGIFDTDWTTEVTTDHKYDVAGEYEVILQVQNTEGLTDEATLTITIAEEGFAPEAKFTVTSDSQLADSDVGTTATEFKFNSSSSSDEEDYSSELEVRWDYDGDGDFDTTWDDEKIAYNQYLETGEYEVTLEVRDTDGNVSETTYDIRVVENTAPYATFEVADDEATPGVEFEFDAGACFDDQYKSVYLEVRWDYDGDGNWDTSFSTDKTTEHYYDDSGTYDVIMQVKDPESQTDEASQTVTVLSNTAPHATFSIDPESGGTYSDKFTFDASASYDDQTAFDDLWFRWDFDYNGESDITYDTSWRHSESTTHYFDSDDGTGDMYIRLEVKDEDGETSSVIGTASIHWSSSYLEELRSRGIIKGYDDGMRPDQNITRAELVKIVVEALEESVYGMDYQGYFSDVTDDDWHWKYVEKAYELGIIGGYDDGTFGPSNDVNRAEAVKIIVGAFGIDTSGTHEGGVFDDVSAMDWFFKYVMTAYDEGLVSGYGDGTFGPGDSMTRGEAAKVVWLAM